MEEELGLSGTIARYFEAGGWMMYPITLVALAGVSASIAGIIVAFVARKPGRTTLALSTAIFAVGLLALGLGLLGQQMALRTVEEAVAHVNPADKAVILMAGSSEARVCVIYGGFAALLPMVVGAAMLGLGIARLERFAGAGGPPR